MTSPPSEPGPDPRLPGLAPAKPLRLPVLPFGPVALGAMVLLTLVLIGAIFALGRYGAAPTTPAPEGPGGAGPDTDILPRKPQFEVLGPAELATIIPEETRDELQTELKTWFQAVDRRPIDDRNGADEPEWVAHILSDDVLPRLERLPGHVFGELPDTARVLDEPGPHRGMLVTVWGRVVSIDAAALPTAPPEATAWRVRMDDVRGNPWTVTCVREPPPEIVPGGWARGFGVFTKLYPCEAKRPSFGLFTPQTLVRSYPPFDPTAIDPAWAASVGDATLEDSLRKPGDEDAFWRLCAYVRTLGTDGYRRKVAAGEIRVLDATNSRTLTALVNDPGPHRFEAVRVRAAPLHSEFGVESGLDENPGHVKGLYRGFVADDLHRPVWVAAPFPASHFSFEGARLVEVEGFFYKRIATTGKSGNMYWLPVVVATSIEPVEFGSSSRVRWARIAVWVVAAGALFLGVVWVRVVIRSRREAAAARQRHLERMSKRKGGAEVTA